MTVKLHWLKVLWCYRSSCNIQTIFLEFINPFFFCEKYIVFKITNFVRSHFKICIENFHFVKEIKIREIQMNYEKLWLVLIPTFISVSSTYYLVAINSFFKDFCAYVTQNAPKEKHVIAANEGNAVAIATGYHLATGKHPMVYLQVFFT